MPKPDEARVEASKEQTIDASVAVVRPFLDAHNAYYNQMNESWHSAQRDLKDLYCAHAKACKAMQQDVQKDITDAAGRYKDALQAASQSSPEDQRREAAGTLSRYHADANLAQVAAAQKWIAHKQELENAISQLQKSYLERSRATYHAYLEALKPAWQSADPKQLAGGLIGHINRLTDEVARHAWHVTGAP
jgi:hypothetical protein